MFLFKSKRELMSLRAGVNMLQLPSLLASQQAPRFPEPVFIPNPIITPLCNDPILWPWWNEKSNAQHIRCQSPDGSTVFLSAACRWWKRAYFSGHVVGDDKITYYIKHVFFWAKAEKYLSWLAESVCFHSVSKPSTDKADRQHGSGLLKAAVHIWCTEAV